MTNSKFKLLLDNLRALILKSRPAYRDYIGTEDVIEKTVLISGKLSADGESVNAKDAFKGFVEGETYKVTVGDETVDATAQYGTGSFSGCIVIGSSNVMPSAEIPGWMICVYNENLLGYSTGEWVGKSVEVFTEKTMKVDRWDVKKLPEECLPYEMAKQQDVAKQAAKLKQVERSVEDLNDDVQSTQLALTMVEGTANNARSILRDVATEKAQANISFTFDKQTSGRDSFRFNGFDYYKISEFSPASADVISFHGTRADGWTVSSVGAGESSCAYGLFIVVTKAGKCSLPITSTVSGSFTAPSTGLYARFTDNNTAMTAGSAEFTYLRADLLVQTSTGEKLKITADDAGDVYVDSTSGAGQGASSKKLASEKYVDSRLFTFTITPVDGQVSPNLSATRAEMLASLDAGKTLLGYWTETRTVAQTTIVTKHEFRLESVNGTGTNRGLTFVNYEQFYKSTLYVNGNDTISFVDKEVLPVPMTKTEAMTQSVGMDDDGRLWTAPGASGGNAAPIIYVNKSNNAYTDADCQNQYSVDGLAEAVQAGAKVYYREHTSEPWTIYPVLTTLFDASTNTLSVVFLLGFYTEDGSIDWSTKFTDGFESGISAPNA